MEHSFAAEDRMFIFLDAAQIDALFTRFMEANPSPTTELIAPNPYTLLVAVVLSAQATDKSVNKATEELFKIADTPEKMLALGQAGLESYIKSVGLYRTKAKHVIELSKILIEKHGGAVPHSREDLEMLPGVGRKTANVILNVVYGEPTMPVDTHLLRISPRMGLSAGTTPAAVEKILHGRYVCTARSPQCGQCSVNDICPRNGLQHSIV